jgi:hypothetical protein
MIKRQPLKFVLHLVLGAILLLACQPVEKRLQQPAADEEAGSVPLTITEAMTGSDPNVQTWLAACGSEKFLVAFAHSETSFTTGSFCRYQDTDARHCLDSIAQALEAKRVEAPRERAKCLPFEAAILDLKVNRNLEDDPKGTWIATKIFVADGEGEFYLNLSPETGEAEISIKDPEYGNVVVRELAKVLAGPG